MNLNVAPWGLRKCLRGSSTTIIYIYIYKFFAYRRIYDFSCVTSCHVLSNILEKLILLNITCILTAYVIVCATLFRSYFEISISNFRLYTSIFLKCHSSDRIGRYTTFNSFEEIRSRYYLFFVKKLRKCYVSKESR